MTDLAHIAQWRVAPWVHSLDVGGSLVLFNEKLQELHRLDGVAATAWSAFRNVGSSRGDRSPARLPSSLVRTWIERELIVPPEHPLTFDQRTGARSQRFTTRRYQGMTISESGCVRRHYRILGHDIAVRVPSPAVAERIDSALAHVASPEHAEPATIVDVIADRRSYTIVNEGQVLDCCDDLRMLAAAVKAWLTQIAAARTPHLLGLHAAALALDRAAILLPAPSGTGKTMLALAGLHAGLQYLSDDMVLLNHEAPVVMPVVNALCLKEGGLELARRFVPEAAGLMTHLRPDRAVVRYYRPEVAYAGDAADSWRVRAMIFPVRSDGRTSATGLTAIDALHRLLANCCSVARLLSRAHVEMLVELVEGSQNYELQVGHPGDAIELIVQLCRATSAPPIGAPRGKNMHGKVAG